jgi:hypothetical protein
MRPRLLPARKQEAPGATNRSAGVDQARLARWRASVYEPSLGRLGVVCSANDHHPAGLCALQRPWVSGNRPVAVGMVALACRLDAVHGVLGQPLGSRPVVGAEQADAAAVYVAGLSRSQTRAWSEPSIDSQSACRYRSQSTRSYCTAPAQRAPTNRRAREPSCLPRTRADLI